MLSIEEEAIIIAFRRHTLLPLDDCLNALQLTIPHLTRSSLHRCLQRHGISRLPDVAGDKPDKKKVKTYPIGYFRRAISPRPSFRPSRSPCPSQHSAPIPCRAPNEMPRPLLCLHPPPAESWTWLSTRCCRWNKRSLPTRRWRRAKPSAGSCWHLPDPETLPPLDRGLRSPQPLCNCTRS